MTILNTKRLSLEVTEETDIPILQQILADKEVTRLTFGGKPMTFEESTLFIRNHFNMSGKMNGISPLKEKQSKNIIGFAGLIPYTHFSENDFEFGFVLARSAWGKGYATEIGKAQIDYAFKRLEVDRLFAMAAPANKSSIHILTKLGLIHKFDLIDQERGLRKVYCITKRHSLNEI